MSGTVGGAMMGALYGVPALAVSLGARTTDFDYSARFVVHLIQELRQHPPMRGIVLSVNIPRAPETEHAGVVVARMGGSDLHFAYEEIAEEDGERRFRPRIGRGANPPDQGDTEGFMRDMITITPLQFDWTAHSVVAEMKKWAISKVATRWSDQRAVLRCRLQLSVVGDAGEGFQRHDPDE